MPVKFQQGMKAALVSFTCPTRLRPAIESFESHNSNCDPASNEENVIVNFEKLSSLLADSIHQCEKPSLVVKLLNRKGLCITAQSHCLICGYISTPCELYTRIKKKRGPTAGSLNALENINLHDILQESEKAVKR